MVTPLWPWLLNEPTITGNLDRRAETTPDAVAFMDEHDRSLTWAQFDTSVDRVVAGLAAKGIGRGASVAWQLPTRMSTVLVMFALRRLAAQRAPIISLCREREVSAAVRAVNADFLLIPGTWNDFDYAAMVSRLDLGDVLSSYGHRDRGGIS